MTRAGSGASGAAFALIGGGAADFLDQERADAALGIITSDPGHTGINDVANAINRHGSFGDVRGNNHFSQWTWRKSAVLVFGRKVAVERNEIQLFGSMNRAGGAH